MPITIPPPGDDLRRENLLLSNLKVSANNPPDMKVQISAGGFWLNDSKYLEYNGGQSRAIDVPSGSGINRLTVVLINKSGNIKFVHGSASTSVSNLELPTMEGSALPLAAIQITASDTEIDEDKIFDIRPIHAIGASVNISISAVANLWTTLDSKLTISELSTFEAAISASTAQTKSSISVVEDFAASVQTLISENASTIIDLQNNVSTLDILLASAQPLEDQNASVIGVHTTELATASNSVSSLQASVTQNMTDSGVNANNISLVTNRQDTLNASILTTQKRTIVLTNFLEGVASAVDQDSSALTELEASVANLGSLVGALGSTIAVNQAHIGALQGSVTLNASNIADVSATTTALFASVDQNASRLTLLQASVLSGSGINEFADVSSVIPASGYSLFFDAGQGKWIPASITTTTISQLSDYIDVEGSSILAQSSTLNVNGQTGWGGVGVKFNTSTGLWEARAAYSHTQRTGIGTPQNPMIIPVPLGVTRIIFANDSWASNDTNHGGFRLFGSTLTSTGYGTAMSGQISPGISNDNAYRIANTWGPGSGNAAQSRAGVGQMTLINPTTNTWCIRWVGGGFLEGGFQDGTWMGGGNISLDGPLTFLYLYSSWDGVPGNPANERFTGNLGWTFRFFRG